MKTAQLMMLLAVIGIPALAQNNSCPLQPTLVKDVASHISVALQNNSGKQVASYTVGLTFYDTNGHAHAFPDEFTDVIKLQGHGHRTAVWNSPKANQFLLPLAKVYLKQASFTDGTDGT